MGEKRNLKSVPIGYGEPLPRIIAFFDNSIAKRMAVVSGEKRKEKKVMVSMLVLFSHQLHYENNQTHL